MKPFQIFVINATVALCYFLLGLMMYALSQSGGYISPIWPSAGLALAVVLIYGNQTLVGIFLGSFAVNYGLSGLKYGFWVALIVAMGAALQAYVGQILIKRSRGYSNALITSHAVGQLLFFGALLSTMINASIGTISLQLSSNSAPVNILQDWCTWWLGDMFGVILLTPIIIGLLLRKEVFWRGRAALVAAGFSMIIAVVAVIFLLVMAQEKQRLENSMTQSFTAIKSAFSAHITSHIAALRNVATVMDIGNPASNPRYQHYMQELLNSNPGFKAISWDQLLEGAAANQQGVNTTGPRRVIVKDIFPLQGNKEVLGYDVYTDPDRRKAIDHAIRTNALSSTSKISLVQKDKESQGGMLLFLPHTLASGEMGFVTGVLELSSFTLSALQQLPMDKFNIVVAENGRADRRTILYENRHQEISPVRLITELSAADFERRVSLSIGDKELLLDLTPTQDWIIRQSSRFPQIMLVFCILLTALMGYHLLVITGKQYTIRRLSEKERKQNLALAASNSELKKTLDSLKQAQCKIVEQEKNAALGHLVASLAHEINTPLGISVTASSVIKEAAREMLDMLQSNAIKKSTLQSKLENVKSASQALLNSNARATDLIERFKLLSAGSDETERQSFYLSETIEHVVANMRPRIDAEGHQIHINCSVDQVYSFPNTFYYLFTYLITGSLDHGFERQANGEMWLTIHSEQEMLIIEYRDNGEGMSKDMVESIFTPFHTTKRQTGASGLGGAIFYNMITTKLNGSVSCESSKGKGCRFKLSIPL